MLKQKLFPCPDCGHQISKEAGSCPSCGRRINFWLTVFAVIFWVTMAQIFIAFIIGSLIASSYNEYRAMDAQNAAIKERTKELKKQTVFYNDQFHIYAPPGYTPNPYPQDEH